MLNKTEFIERIITLKTPVISKTGKASYSNFRRNDDKLSFKRDNTTEIWEIDLGELYLAYKKLNKINTVIIKQYVGGRVYSPACAFLIASGLYDANGNRILGNE